VPGSPAPASRVRGAANPAQKGIYAFGTASTLREPGADSGFYERAGVKFSQG